MARHLLLRAKFALPPAFLVAASSTDSIRSHPSYHALSDQLITPLIRQLLDAETAHNVAITATSYNLAPFYHPTTTTLSQSAPFPKSPHLKFPSPIGLAAGFDKHATCPRELLSTGFSFVEIGSVTPLPQPGNPKPRVHRLAEDCGVINSYGFNSIGHEAVKANLKANLNSSSSSSSSSSKSKIGLIGVNLGKNKTSESPVEDYVLGIKELGQFGDYLVINVSSPNTPGLRGMQSKKPLRHLCTQCVSARDQLSEKLNRTIPLLVKIAPDLSYSERKDVAEVVLKCKIDGLICGNTTNSRPKTLLSENKQMQGGLSGRPLRELSTTLVADMFYLTGGKIVIVGAGGIGNGADCYEKIRAGASLVQLYSMLAYAGPGVVKKCTEELEELLRKDNKGLEDAIGAANEELRTK